MKNLKKILTIIEELPGHVKVAIVSWICKILIALIQVFTIRILMDYLGSEVYAGYAVLTSLVAWFSLFDFGLGATTQNFISEYKARGLDAKVVLNSVLYLVLILFSVGIIFVAIISVPLQSFLFSNLGSLAAQPKFILGIAGFLYIVSSLTGIAYRVYYAQEKGYLSNIYPALASIVSLLLLFLVGFSPAKKTLLLMILITILPNAIFGFYAFYDVFIKQVFHKFCIDKQILKAIFSRSYRFAGLSFASAIILQLDYIVMSRLVLPEDITVYNLISKVYFLIFFIYSSLLMALWPNCAELFEKKDVKKVFTLIKKNMLFGFFIVLSGTLFFSLTNEIIATVLTGGEIHHLPKITIAIFGFYYCVRVWSDTFAMLLQSINKLKIFWIYSPIMAIISILGQYFLGRSYGINGIVVGITISFLLTSVWIVPLTLRRVISKYYS